MVVLTTFDTRHAESNTVTPRREPEHPVSINTCTHKSHEHVDQYMLRYFYHLNSGAYNAIAISTLLHACYLGT